MVCDVTHSQFEPHEHEGWTAGRQSINCGSLEMVTLLGSHVLANEAIGK
jgi:hypothetical protein